MKDLYLILPETPSTLLENMIHTTIKDKPYKIIKDHKNLPDLKNKNLLFAIEINRIGVSNNLNNIFLNLYKRGKDSLLGSHGALLIHSKYNMFTKTAAQSIIFLSNELGCSFIGRPLVEANENLDNFIPMEKVYNLSLENICLMQCKELGERFLYLDKEININEDKKLLVLHSSTRQISNTLILWDMVKDSLEGIDIIEINLGNGNIFDCKGCPYKACKYYGKQNKCFYGGIIIEEVYPAVLETNSIIFICPNYNDMITANLVASINRLTALYRKTKFYDKTLFSIIVSGYSGGDALAKQLISSLNINKTFKLPPYFSLRATANDMGAIKKVKDIKKISKDYAINLMNNI